jgi:hypothetical protein
VVLVVSTTSGWTVWLGRLGGSLLAMFYHTGDEDEEGYV